MMRPEQLSLSSGWKFIKTENGGSIVGLLGKIPVTLLWLLRTPFNKLSIILGFPSQSFPANTCVCLTEVLSLQSKLPDVLIFQACCSLEVSKVRKLISCLKGVFSSHKSVTGILPNNPTMLPPFSVFMNFHPNLSDSCSCLIIRLERSQCCN